MQNIILENINNELEKLLKMNALTNSKAIFELGIKVGRHLELNKIDDYECDYWKITEDKRNIIDKINKLFCQVIKYAIKKQIALNDEWVIGTNENNNSKFDVTVVDECGLQFNYCKIDDTQDLADFELFFEAQGEIEQMFVKYKLRTQFTAKLEAEYGYNERVLTNEHDVETIYWATCNINSSHDYKELNDLYNLLTQHYTFLLLKI